MTLTPLQAVQAEARHVEAMYGHFHDTFGESHPATTQALARLEELATEEDRILAAMNEWSLRT
jgi:hypothetical protein